MVFEAETPNKSGMWLTLLILEPSQCILVHEKGHLGFKILCNKIMSLESKH